MKKALFLLSLSLGTASTAMAYDVNVVNQTSCTCEQPSFELINCKIVPENAADAQAMNNDFEHVGDAFGDGEQGTAPAYNPNVGYDMISVDVSYDTFPFPTSYGTVYKNNTYYLVTTDHHGMKIPMIDIKRHC